MVIVQFLGPNRKPSGLSSEQKEKIPTPYEVFQNHAGQICKGIWVSQIEAGSQISTSYAFNSRTNKRYPKKKKSPVCAICFLIIEDNDVINFVRSIGAAQCRENTTEINSRSVFRSVIEYGDYVEKIRKHISF